MKRFSEVIGRLDRTCIEAPDRPPDRTGQAGQDRAGQDKHCRIAGQDMHRSPRSSSGNDSRCDRQALRFAVRAVPQYSA